MKQNIGLKNHQKSNRIRRIPKRIKFIQSWINKEKLRAKSTNREPELGEAYARINRLNSRLIELTNVG